jgi:hypothetical protein
LLVLQSDWLVANVWAIGMSVETDASGPSWLRLEQVEPSGLMPRDAAKQIEQTGLDGRAACVLMFAFAVLGLCSA